MARLGKEVIRHHPPNGERRQPADVASQRGGIARDVGQYPSGPGRSPTIEMLGYPPHHARARWVHDHSYRLVELLETTPTDKFLQITSELFLLESRKKRAS